MINVNSIRPDGGTSLRALSEVRPVAHASRMGKSLADVGGAGQRDNERVLKETVNERKAATSPEGGWRQNGRKCKRGKQGDLSGITRRSWPEGPKNRPTGVRASIVAKKRVTSVEPRDAGRWKDEEQNNGGPTDASARKGYAAAGDPPSTIDWAGTARLAGILVRAKSGRHLAETPLTGKLDAGNPPVQFGGRGEVNPSSLPLSVTRANHVGKMWDAHTIFQSRFRHRSTHISAFRFPLGPLSGFEIRATGIGSDRVFTIQPGGLGAGSRWSVRVKGPTTG